MSCFWGHNWENWEQYKWVGKVRYDNKFNGEWAEVEESHQRRKCKSCGRMEDEEIR